MLLTSQSRGFEKMGGNDAADVAPPAGGFEKGGGSDAADASALRIALERAGP